MDDAANLRATPGRSVVRAWEPGAPEPVRMSAGTPTGAAALLLLL